MVKDFNYDCKTIKDLCALLSARICHPRKCPRARSVQGPTDPQSKRKIKPKLYLNDFKLNCNFTLKIVTLSCKSMKIT
jgi:hypothetical protein